MNFIIKRLSSLIIVCPEILKIFIRQESVAHTIFFLVSMILHLTWSTTSNQLPVSDVSTLSQLFCVQEDRFLFETLLD